MPLTLEGPVLERLPASPCVKRDRLRVWLEDQLRPGSFHAGSWICGLLQSETVLPAATSEALSRALGCPDLFLIDADQADRPTLREVFLASVPASRVLVLMEASSLETLRSRELALRQKTEDGYRLEEAKKAVSTLQELRLRRESLESERATSLRDRTRISEDLATDPDFQKTTEQQELSLQATLEQMTAERLALTERLNELVVSKAALVSENPSGLLNRLFHRKKTSEHEATLADVETQIRSLQAEESQLQSRRLKKLQDLEVEKSQYVKTVRTQRAAEIDARLAGLDLELQSLTESTTAASEILTQQGLNSGLVMGLPANDSFSDLESLRVRIAARERANPRNSQGVGIAAQGLLDLRLAVFESFEFLEHQDDIDKCSTFDWLWVESAEDLKEEQFLTAMRLAPRRVLVGCQVKAQDRGDSSCHVMNGARFSKGDPVAMDVFSRLSSRLNQEAWALEDDRLVCRVLPIAEEEAPSLIREPLLDRPEIELRFTAQDRGETALASVAFPRGATTAEAKAFLFAHLGEVLLRPVGESHTHDHSDAVVVCWPAVDREESSAEWVSLDPGVREKVIGNGLHAYTAAVAFKRDHGWTAERAAAWLADHLPSGSPSRVAVLPRRLEYAMA